MATGIEVSASSAGSWALSGDEVGSAPAYWVNNGG